MFEAVGLTGPLTSRYCDYDGFIVARQRRYSTFQAKGDSRMTRDARQSSQPETQRLSSVAAAARVLKEFDKDDRQLGVTQLARRIHISKSATHRIIWTLVDEGLLEKVEETGLFRLSLKMWALGANAETVQKLHQACTLPLDRLRRFTAGTIQIGILEGFDVLYIERREGAHGFQVFRSVGTRNAAHVTSSGKVLLGHLPTEQQEQVISQMPLYSATSSSITSVAQLRTELSTIRKQGWAQNLEESHSGMFSVAAPIRDSLRRVVASVSVAQRTEVKGETVSSLTVPVTETAALISRGLGWRP